jgi:Flp pilus assembly protein TadG
MSVFSRFRIGSFKRDERAVSAVEFALLAPMMIGIYLGSVEISEGISVDRKVTLAAGAVANLAAQTSTLSTSDMTDILDATTDIIAPYSASPLKITVSCINIDANKSATVKWSVTRNGTLKSGSVTLPTALQVANTQLLFGEVSYAYTPTIGHVIKSAINLSDTMYMAPRISAPKYNGTACT